MKIKLQFVKQQHLAPNYEPFAMNYEQKNTHYF